MNKTIERQLAEHVAIVVAALKDRNEMLERENAELMRQLEDPWISVKDELPMDMQVVDIWYEGNMFGGERVAEVRFYKDKNLFSGHDYSFKIDGEHGKVTHWMRTPKGPGRW